MCIACDCRGNGVKNRSGIWGSSCGFQSDKIQKPMLLVCAPVLPAPLPRFNDWRFWGGMKSGEGMVKEQLKPRARIRPAPQDLLCCRL